MSEIAKKNMVKPRSAPAETFPIANLDLVEEIRQLRTSSIPHGHLAKTVVRNRDLRVVLMVLVRGAKLPRHHARGSLAIQALEGRVVLSLLDSTFDLGPGRVLAIEPGIEHALVAIEDSALMITVSHARADSPVRVRLSATGARQRPSTRASAVHPASAAEIVALLGELEPLTLEQLLATRATISEIASAVDAIEDEDAFGEIHHAPLSPREAEVRAILEQLVFENAEEREAEREIARS